MAMATSEIIDSFEEFVLVIPKAAKCPVWEHLDFKVCRLCGQERDEQE